MIWVVASEMRDLALDIGLGDDGYVVADGDGVGGAGHDATRLHFAITGGDGDTAFNASDEVTSVLKVNRQNVGVTLSAERFVVVEPESHGSVVVKW